MARTAQINDSMQNTAMAKLKALRSSPQKANLVLQMIRGKKVDQALLELGTCEKRTAYDIKKVLMSAIANAENNHGLDIDKLVISEAIVGKAFVMKRWRARARGRAAKIMKPFSNIRITVKEQEV
jgi:large subunit ribosomal protein L22